MTPLLGVVSSSLLASNDRPVDLSMQELMHTQQLYNVGTALKRRVHTTLGGQLELIMKAIHNRKALSCTPTDHQRQQEACAQQQQHVVKLCRRTLVIKTILVRFLV